ncbi:aminotransferase class IV [Micromonospora sp. WMMD558]|uniref:aminotransferase class IV n=1 Tax=Micromonospora sp. WMMD558 TaxID=3403462 RepID=UPI003BF60CB6
MVDFVAVYGTGFVDPDEPVAHADDLGLLRGDGAFEALLLHGGKPMLLEEHMDRLYASARRIELELPDRLPLTEFVNELAAAWPADVEGVLRIVCTRGRSGAGRPTIFGTVDRLPAATAVNRRHGVTARTATNGYPVAGRLGAPWLLGGVKSLSYAVNLASHRWALSQGAQEMLWLSTEGYVLESPSYSLLWITGSTLFSVPAWTGIVAGTTAATLLASARHLGLAIGEALVTPVDLARADGVWFTGSLSGVLAVTEIDGNPLRRSPLLEPARSLIGYPGALP